MTDKVAVLNTCGSLEEARRVARAIVESRLAACVNILPGVESIYRWHGVVEEANEWMLVIKTRRDLVPDLLAEIREAHTYEIPEAVVIAIVDGLPDYLAWLGRETRPGDPLPD